MKHSLPGLCASALLAIACTGRGPSEPGGASVTTDPISLAITSLEFAADEVESPVVLTHQAAGPVAWRSEVSAPWLSVEPAAGTLSGGSATLRVRVTRQSLPPGIMTGRVQFVAGERALVLDVTAAVASRPLAVLDRTRIEIGPDEAGAALRLDNLGNAPLQWSLSGPPWLTISPGSGTLAPGAAQVIAVAPESRESGADLVHAELVLTSNGGDAGVEIEVRNTAPARLRVEPSRLDFGTGAGPLEVRLFNDGGRPLTWSAAGSSAWLRPAPAGGTIPPGGFQSVGVTRDPQGLPAGTYRATLDIASDGGGASIPVEAVVSSSSSTALEGRIVDQLTGASVSGLTVQFSGSMTTTDTEGRFWIPGAPSSNLRQLTIFGSAIQPRTTYARAGEGTWRVIPATFDMSAFNDVAREFEPRTIRWLGPPRIYIDSRPEGFQPGPELDLWIQEVRERTAAFITAWSGSAITASSVTVTSSPPPDGTSGTIVIHFSEGPQRYAGDRTVGLARTYWSSSREITAAVLWLRLSLVGSSSSARAAVLGHELGHGMGMGHMDGTTVSIMTPRLSVSSLSPFDLATGGIVYSRSPGNSHPDTDQLGTFVGGLAPSGAAAGYDTWVCGAPEP